MKIPRRALALLLLTLLALYTSGLVTWVLTHWFLLNSGFGLEPSPLRTFWLQVHGVVSLWFMVLFGYLFHSHVRPAWRLRKKRLSGGVLTGVLTLLMLTVPMLYYSSHEALKAGTVWVHTYLGLATVLIFLVHYFALP